VRAILNDPQGGFAVRAITRDAASPKAQELAKLGAEVVSADVDDVASLTQALQGAYGAYFVTFFWDHFSPERELQSAHHMADAAKAAGVEHVIWSTLEDTRHWVPLADDRMPTLMGKYKVPHFDAKGEADQYFRDKGVPTTFLLTSFYWDNFIHFGMGPKPGPDGTLTLAMPMADKKLAGIAAEDIGRTAYGIFKRGKDLIGHTVGTVGEHLTGAEIATKMGKAFGQPVQYYALSPEQYRGFGFPGADDLGNMFQVYAEFEAEFGAPRNAAAARELNPQMQDFDTWLTANKDRIPLQ
jgi:uncharacterized protein YbjT (DUF2867 family)